MTECLHLHWDKSVGHIFVATSPIVVATLGHLTPEGTDFLWYSPAQKKSKHLWCLATKLKCMAIKYLENVVPRIQRSGSIFLHGDQRCEALKVALLCIFELASLELHNFFIKISINLCQLCVISSLNFENTSFMTFNNYLQINRTWKEN